MPTEPVDLAAEHQALEEALVAEQVDERDRRQQRGREDRDQRQRLEQALPAHAAALQRIGVDEGQRQHDQRGNDGDEQAVPHRLEQRGRGEVVDVVGESDEVAVLVLEALGQERPQRQHERDEHPADQEADAPAHQQVVAIEPAAGRREKAGGARPGGAPPLQAAGTFTASAAPGGTRAAARAAARSASACPPRSTGRARR